MMMRICNSKYGIASIALVSVVAAAGCESSSFSNGMEGFTNAVEGFTERVKSQNTSLNNSTVEFSGDYTFGEVNISATGTEVLTPAQLKDARSDVSWRYMSAYDANDVVESKAWADVSREFEDEFTTLNEVLVFKVDNRSYDDLYADDTSILIVASDNSRKEHAVFSEKALGVLNNKAFLLDRDSNDRIQYTSGKLDTVPALSTKYYGVIVPRMKKGSYTAVVSNFPGAEERLSFEVVKN